MFLVSRGLLCLASPKAPQNRLSVRPLQPAYRHLVTFDCTTTNHPLLDSSSPCRLIVRCTILFTAQGTTTHFEQRAGSLGNHPGPAIRRSPSTRTLLNPSTRGDRAPSPRTERPTPAQRSSPSPEHTSTTHHHRPSAVTRSTPPRASTRPQGPAHCPEPSNTTPPGRDPQGGWPLYPS